MAHEKNDETKNNETRYQIIPPIRSCRLLYFSYDEVGGTYVVYEEFVIAWQITIVDDTQQADEFTTVAIGVTMRSDMWGEYAVEWENGEVQNFGSIIGAYATRSDWVQQHAKLTNTRPRT